MKIKRLVALFLMSFSALVFCWMVEMSAAQTASGSAKLNIRTNVYPVVTER